MLMSVFGGTVLGLVLIAARSPFLSLYNLQPDAVNYAKQFMLVLGCIWPFSALEMVGMVPLMYVVAIATGTLVAFIPAILDRQFKANVVVVSLMLNSIIGFFCTWVLRYKMKDSTISFIGSKEIPESAQMASIFGKFRIQSGLVVALLCLVLVSVLFYKTPFGWKMRMIRKGGEGCVDTVSCGPVVPGTQ